MRIAQLSDIHVGEGKHDPALLEAAIDEINAEPVDLVVVAGDLTGEGLRTEFEQARDRLARLACPEVVMVPGNHDARSGGYLHFEDLFGERFHERELDLPEGRARVVCVDSSKPDLDDGEVGRELYGWLAEAFDVPADLKVLVMHHHLVAIPGTGRDRNQVWDAGDVLALLARCGVDLMLGGHRHVPHVWPVAGLYLVHSGTVSTGRVRGYARPSYNLVEVDPDELRVEACHPGGPRELLARFPRPGMTGGEHRTVEAVRPVRGLRLG